MIETPFIKLWKENQVLWCVYANDLEVDLEIARLCVKTGTEFSAGESNAMIIDVRGVRFITKEARDYLGSESAGYISAGAILVGSPLTKMLGNIFLRVNKPVWPAKLFTNEADAEQWLQQFIKYDFNEVYTKRRAPRALG